ncbi:MAG: aminotransferase class V-fold PLP-dependent enzyme, partial [Clostridiales bacterium]|nr:aminotransferase class V-fold PLP-dependent enzyme [Clostridiales bacterium]
YTFIASISTIILSGATPVLTEIDESLTIAPDDIEKKITKKTKAIMAVHMLGNMCDMERIMSIAKKHGLYVIEDCCQAVGGTYKGQKCGAIGDIAAHSLNIFKVITSGDGGVVTTNNEKLYETAFGYHDHGHKPSRMGVEVGNRSIVGMNLRMNELSGAVALAQTRKLEYILTTLRKNKKRLKAKLIKNGTYEFRKLNDEHGECATLLTLIFKDERTANKYANLTGTKPIASSGWHVYNNMEQIINGKNIRKHMLAKTDLILARSFNISIGVVDKGLGASIGININSSNDEIDEKSREINEILKALE